MPDVPLQFTWEVAESGHHWVQTHALDEQPEVRRQYLTHGHGFGRHRVLRYQPLVMFSGLFRTFAETEPTLEAIKAFADRYGLLGGDLGKQIALCDQAKSSGGAPFGIGEQAGGWTGEILTMRLAIQLWEAARQGDLDWLGQVIFWEPDGSGVRIDTDPGLDLAHLPKEPFYSDKAWVAGTHLGDDVLGTFVRGDLIKPALFRMQRIINDHLRRRASPRLLWDARRERLGLYIQPEGLIGALWLQFARAVERDTKFRRCVECSTWFELSPGTGRADKVFCSTPCRTKAYRKRQAEAARLHAEGREIEDIARELQSEPDTVRGWIERHQQAGASGRSGSG